MLTWLIRRARTGEKSSGHRLIVQVAYYGIAGIGSAYEHSTAGVLRRRRRRGIVHSGGTSDRHRAAVALAAHPRARRGAERTPDRASTAWDRADARGAGPSARGALGRAGRRAGAPRSACATRARSRRARDRNRAVDGGGPAAALHPGLA